MSNTVGRGHDVDADIESDSLSDDGVSDKVVHAEAALLVITTVAKELQHK